MAGLKKSLKKKFINIILKNRCGSPRTNFCKRYPGGTPRRDFREILAGICEIH